MKTLRCLVADDERLARQLIETYIDKIPGLHLVASCATAMEALGAITQSEVDLVFLDIQMPDLSGIELINTLRNKCPMVVFTTAYQEFALKGYELGVVDYLLKPFSLERFVQAVQKCREMDALRFSPPSTNVAIMEPVAEEQSITSFFVKSGQKLVRIQVDDILYVEGMKEYVAIQCVQAKILTFERMKNMEVQLEELGFVRIHRSYIVAVSKIVEIENYRVKIGGIWLPIGRNYKSVLSQLVNSN